MRRILATLAVVALLFSAGSAWAEGTYDISDWLESIGLQKYEEAFLSNDITPDILPGLTNADLKEMGINSLGARKRILKAIKEGPAPVATEAASAEEDPKPADFKAYCKRDDGSVVAVDRLNLDIPCGPHTEISNTFRDCSECPEMVVVPSGSFMMGSPESEVGRYRNEGPVHRVSVHQPFAIGKYEVTFAEWDACVSGGGCNGYRPHDEFWGRGKRPVINVSWKDATSYTSWLSRKTGHAYRLPSEAEWEYAARAGTDTRYHFGNNINPSEANHGWNIDGTVAVGSYPANAFGLHDVHGNVEEWVEDCWNESYVGAPSDTSVWKAGDCSFRVLRGGTAASTMFFVRSAHRDWSDIGRRHSMDGFRISRTLP